MQIRPYKCLNENSQRGLAIQAKHSFFYIRQSKNVPLLETEVDGFDFPNNFELICQENDENSWNKETDSAFMNIEVSMENTDSLFGNQGICLDNAVLGVGLEWKAEKSKIKNCVKLGEICKGADNHSFSLSDIEIKEITSNIEINLVFYLAKPGQARYRLPSIGNQKGLILGEIPLFTILSGGTASFFPIMPIVAKDQPLWSIYFDANEPTDDFSKENLGICLNTAHPDYKYIDISNKEFYCESFLREVIESAVTLLFLQIKRLYETSDVSLEDKGATGSIQQAVSYLATNGIKITDDDQQLHAEIQNYLRGRKI